MGYSTRNSGYIKDYWPDDTDTEFFMTGPISLGDIYDRASEKWPGILPEELSIDSEYIHTHCLTYDCYDPGDYTNFLKISKI